jgi:5-methylcytosine-specific restriction enzyme A
MQVLSTPHSPKIDAWYTSSFWLKRRRHQLRVAPLCQTCLEAGRVEPATVADHVESHRGNYTAFRLGRLRSLCKACHDALDHMSNAPRRWGCDVTGMPLDPRHPWNAGRG